MTVIHIQKTPQYLNSRHVTYYVITCKSAFDWVYAKQWYVIITFDVTDTHPDRVSEIHANKAVEAGSTNKLCPFQYSSTCHERTPSGPGKSVRTLQVAARHRDGRAGG